MSEEERVDKNAKEKANGIDLPKVDGEEVTEKPHKSFIEMNKTEEGLLSMHKGPRLSRDPWSRASFWGAGRLVRQGAKRIIKHDDIMSLPEQYRSITLWNTFEPIWREELKNEKPSLFRALKKMFLGELLLTLFIQTIYGLTAFVIPVVIPYMLRYIIFPNRDWWLGLMYIGIIFVVSLAGSFCYYLSQFMSNMIGIEIRSVLTQMAYRKVLNLEPTKKTNSGVIVNLIANDTQFFADTLGIFNSGLTSPVQIIVATGLMWWHIGAYALEGIGVFILLMPLAMWLGRRFGTFRQKIQAMGDRRLKLTNELIQGIRIVKFYAWEDALLKNIDKAREAELKQVQGLGWNRAFLIAVMSNTTTLVTIAIFLSYSLGKENFTADVAFSILSLINLLRLPFFILPFTLSLVQQYKVTFERISNFALLPEMTGTRVQTGEGEPLIEIKNGAFSWDYSNAEATPTLKDVNIRVKTGELHMVVGAVGSGKSTLANGVFGEVRQISGTRSLQGSVAYVPQEAWIINATVKENILFGEPFDVNKYEDVLEASALKADLIQLPLGDQTEIGERGITLSGGQKQRVSIARALYSNRQVLVMDDPFSAVDSHVGKHLFEKAVQGYLKGKTILLVTNQLQYLAFADNVYVLEEGKMVASGKLFDIKDSCKPLQSLLQNFGEIEEAKEEPKKEEVPKERKPDATFAKMMERKDTVARAELKQEGLVGITIYWYYIKAGGVAVFIILLFLYAFATICSIMSSWWLAKWTEYPVYPAEGQWGPRKVEFFVWVYVGWLLGQALFTLIAYLVLVVFSTAASRFLHSVMIRKVVRAPSSFFDVTPVGRIINRFAKELGLIDALLPMQISQYVNSIFTLLGVFAAMAFGSAWILLAIAPAVAFYLWFQTHYRHTSIELQRLESISRAPIFSHLSETMNGTSCIRAYGMQETFKNMNCYKVDYNTVELHALRYCAGWFGLRLDWLGQFLVFLTLGAIVLTRNYANSIDVGFAGIAMTYMSGITFILSSLNLTAVELETRMNSVERVKEYESLEQEAPAEIPEKKPPAEWPTKGTLEFQDYSLAYRKGERVLDSISAFVDDKDKIGIVGRTGAGKSSLMLALFRMVEPEQGKIIIDGVDITSIGLKDLRTKLAIIPQDPVLFMGSLRYNLDPFEEHSDKELWDVLQMVRLKKVVTALKGKLDEPVEERGANFSVGQRQLICMARALLRKSKILLMDEATASVDINTDALIQKMVRKNFADVTVLTIAHRLNTIMDSTKVMVLSKGKVAEYEAPGNKNRKKHNLIISETVEKH